MSEEVKDSENQIDYKAFYEAHKDVVEKVPGLLAKKDELLNEAKQAKAKARELEEMSKAEKERLAKEQGQYELLWKEKEKELNDFKEQYMNEKKAIRSEKVKGVASRIAVGLAKNDYDAEILSDIISRSVNDIADENGNINQDVIESIKKQYAADKRYESLMKGNMSAGGSAQGSSRAVSSIKEMSYADFDKLDASSKLEAAKQKMMGKLKII